MGQAGPIGAMLRTRLVQGMLPRFARQGLAMTPLLAFCFLFASELLAFWIQPRPPVAADAILSHPPRIVALDRMPPHVPAAFLSAEDRRFYKHPGFDLVGMAADEPSQGEPALMTLIARWRTAPA